MTKLFSIVIPHKYNAGKTFRKVWINAMLSMCWEKRRDIHDALAKEINVILTDIHPIPVTNDDKYRISFGFWSGKSTGNVDIDGLAYIGKVAIDCFAKKVGINDSIQRIKEVRYVYLGKHAEESVVMQVELI